ncbi:MAG: DUF885 family protein [Deltaproteobacteria bacterium]
MHDALSELAVEYFDNIATRFPVMCASDEFHFLPRAEKACQYYDQLDNLDRDVINDCVSMLREFQNRCDLMAAHQTDFERLTDLTLLKANAAGILIELETKQSWRHNPLLYLKLAFIGLDHALTKPAADAKERAERALARMRAIPRLLQQAVNNIDDVPETYHAAAVAMVTDCKDYLAEISKQDAGMRRALFAEALKETWTAIKKLEASLLAGAPVADQEFVVAALEATLREHFLSFRSLPEVFQIAVEEFRENQEQVERLRAIIDPGQSWKALYHGYSPSDIEKTDTISLYKDEIERLGRFFQNHGFADIAPPASLEMRETPTYLRSVRSSASFSAAVGAQAGEKDFFYLTTQLARPRGKEAANHVKKRLHREYKFLSAHETFPGHYLLDSVRRRLENPVRRQIESPLFYEGWAYYAESLLAEYGYVKSPIDHLVDCKRRLWRAARCQIDVGLTTGILSREDAMALVVSAGFSPVEARYQIDHFQLNPGYQLCYSLGRYEIMRLREAYGITLGSDQFHRRLLEGGELPFYLIQERFEHLHRRGEEEE